MVKIEKIHYTEFRSFIYELLDEYDMYKEQADASPRIDLEDSIDNLNIKLSEVVQ